jgi:hypothetical protein
MNSAYLVVFDQASCKKTCESKIPLNKALNPCEAFSYRICCGSGVVHPKYIAYVKVYYSGGFNESWLVN